MTNIDSPFDKAERQATALNSIRNDGRGDEDPAYLKTNVGVALTMGLADIVKKMPSDPIEHLAHFLYKYRQNETMKAQDEEESAKLKNEQADDEEKLMLQTSCLQEQQGIEEDERLKEWERVKKMEVELIESIRQRQREVNEETRLKLQRLDRLKEEYLRQANVIPSREEFCDEMVLYGKQLSSEEMDKETEAEKEARELADNVQTGYIQDLVTDEHKQLYERENSRKTEDELNKETEEQISLEMEDLGRRTLMNEELKTASPKQLAEIDDEQRLEKTQKQPNQQQTDDFSSRPLKILAASDEQPGLDGSLHAGEDFPPRPPKILAASDEQPDLDGSLHAGSQDVRNQRSATNVGASERDGELPDNQTVPPDGHTSRTRAQSGRYRGHKAKSV